MQPLARRLVAGAAAGLIATGTMSLVLALAKKSRLLGEPPPRKFTRKMLNVFGGASRRTTNLATVFTHAGFGASMGAVYGALPPRVANAATGALFGLGVWAVSYAGWVPALGLMEKPSKDRAGRPTAMILAHLVYGATLGESYRRLAKSDAATTEHHDGRRALPPPKLAAGRGPASTLPDGSTSEGSERGAGSSAVGTGGVEDLAE